MSELPKSFEAKDYEDSIYKLWEDSGKFNPDNLDTDETYTIILPPPNATGTLHLGHAMYVVQDILIRYRRMLGKKTLWLPGTDHAAIATQNRVEKNLAKLNPPVTRHQLGRDKFIQEVETFVEGSRDTIRNQLRKMGFSLDWSREAFTLDETRKAAVSELFIRMYNDGLIYRGYRVVNWCPRCQSTLADDEVEHTETTADLITFTYDKNFPIPIATTRPETKFGDVAVAVHPEGKHQMFIGQTYEADFLGTPLRITVIGDTSIDPNFGTGALGVTPAHSKIDEALAQKYGVEWGDQNIVINEAGELTKTFKRADGTQSTAMAAKDARKAIVEALRAQGLLKEEPETISQNLSVCYRCGTAIEPLPKVQWFVNVDHALPRDHTFAGKTLKQVAIEVVENENIEIIPNRFNSTYFHWMNNLHDWCISRQLWYGHRIPAWYNGDEIKVQLDSPGDGWVQDEDVLDTWFSSGMWTFSTLGWPEKSKDLETFHPTQVLETGYDILFFWVARMILITTYALGQVPFEHVYLHGLVRDKQGRKMSKSLGNGIDPLEMNAKYGTDALRVALIAGTTPGNDSRLYEEKIASYRNFINKIWNVGRFVLMNQPALAKPHEPAHLREQSLTDRWFASRVAKVVEEVTGHLENYQLSLASERAYDFLWRELADWYLEINKFQPNPRLVTLGLETVLKLLHPFAPFVTEAIWQQLHPGELLMMASWPKADGEARDAAAEQQFADIQDVVTQVRNLRAQYKIAYTKSFNLYAIAELSVEAKQIVEQLCKVKIVNESAPVGNTTDIINSSYKLTVSLGDLIDVVAERKRLEKELVQLEKYITNQERKLDNKEFTDKAPVEIVEKEQANLAQKKAEQQALMEALAKLQ